MKAFNNEKSKLNSIYLIFANGKQKTVNPNSIRITNFKNTFKNVPDDFDGLFAYSFKGGIALIPSTQIKNRMLWNDSGFSTNVLSDVLNFLSLGEKTKKIFDFNLVKNPLKLISNGANGVVHLVEFEKDDYKEKAILKSTKDVHGDNLLYEYMVGQYINKQCSRFPCFIETYDWLKYKDAPKDASIDASGDVEMAQSSNILITDLEKSKDVLKSLKDSVQKCTDNKQEIETKRDCSEIEKLFGLSCSANLAIMIEYIEAVPLEKMLHNHYFIQNDLINILYQIYMPLATLALEFTHYDLHIGNVLIYELKEDEYIDYEYNFNDDIVTFKCRYIAKIIDYGRAFFDDQSVGSSQSIKKIVCSADLCNPVNKELIKLAASRRKQGIIDDDIFKEIFNQILTYTFNEILEEIFNKIFDSSVKAGMKKEDAYVHAYAYANEHTPALVPDRARAHAHAVIASLNEQNCGDNYGYHFDDMQKYYFPIQKNMSHDLLLIYRIKDRLIETNIRYDLYKIVELFNKVNYGKEKEIEMENKEFPMQRKVEYSTKEEVKSGLKKSRINNVNDACIDLKRIIRDEETNNNRHYETSKSLGTLKIYQHYNMTFDKAE